MSETVPAVELTGLQLLEQRLKQVLGQAGEVISVALGELTIRVKADQYLGAMRLLRDSEGLEFDTLVDLCGMDMIEYRDGTYEGRRFEAVTHLLSVANNQRVRVIASCPEDDFPVLPSLIDVWPAVGWYEREAFDLYGIVFEGHPDLRRILTDYGFVGHPFRKDFPVTGYVEMRYDPDQKRVVYQPVSIEPREIVPRVIREDGYGEGR